VLPPSSVASERPIPSEENTVKLGQTCMNYMRT